MFVASIDYNLLDFNHFTMSFSKVTTTCSEEPTETKGSFSKRKYNINQAKGNETKCDDVLPYQDHGEAWLPVIGQ